MHCLNEVVVSMYRSSHQIKIKLANVTELLVLNLGEISISSSRLDLFQSVFLIFS